MEAIGDGAQIIPAGKLRCYITGKLRPDKPEEHVRQRWARSLVEEYGYSPEDIAVEFRIRIGSKRGGIDLAVFRPGAPHRQENVYIAIEAKREDVKSTDRDEGIGQVKSYMAACSTCRHGLWVGVERFAFSRDERGTIEENVDIPRCGDDVSSVPQFSDLVPALDLNAALRRCHNYIYANQGLHKDKAFHELLRLIFAKVYDETESDGPLRFFVRTDERKSAAGQRRLLEERIGPLFDAVKDRFPYIFPANDKIELAPKVLAYIVAELQRYSLLRTQTDVKGAAYEELVGSNLRGDRGEYFTPRNVCDMAVKMVFGLYPNRKPTSLRILDTCCGTGGFLVSVVNHLRAFLIERESAKGGSASEASERVRAEVRELAARNIYGLDINPFLVQTCQMNLVMHGDGSANVFQADSLALPGEWSDANAAARAGHGRFDVVVTNPPFGSEAIVDDHHVLEQYELARSGSDQTRPTMPPEQLFVEGAWRFLKPGGVMAIVLPDSILNNPSLEFIRNWLFRRSRILASVDLPKETFADSGGVPNPSVLIVQRLTNEEIRFAAGALDPNDVFMAIPKTAGRTKRGDPVYLCTPEGQRVLDDDLKPIIDDELELVGPAFIAWKQVGPMVGRTVESFGINSRLLLGSASRRLDASFYNGAAIAGMEALERSGMDLVEVRDLTEEVFIPNRFKRNYVSAKHGIPFLQGSHVIQFRPDDVKHLSKATHGNIDRLLISEGWILITRSGTVGRVALVTEQWDGWAASEHIFRLIPNGRCPTGYLTAFLSSPLGQLQLNQQIYGAVVDELTEEHIRSIRVPMPATAAQQRAVEAISAKTIQAAKARAAAATMSEEVDREIAGLLPGLR